MKLAALTLGAVVLTTAPVGAGWSTPGTGLAQTSSTALVALAAPTVTASCIGDGTLGLVIRWTPTSTFVSGYEVWRIANNNPATKVTDTGPAVTTANDIQGVGVALRYFVVSRANAWTRTGATTTATNLPVCQPPAPTTTLSTPGAVS